MVRQGRSSSHQVSSDPQHNASRGITHDQHGSDEIKHGLAAIADAVLTARREAISLLVPGHPLSNPATLLPQQNPAGNMASWVNAWKEAIRQAREREAN